jgi:hypothetical protein
LRADRRAECGITAAHEAGEATLDGSPLDEDVAATCAAAEADVGAEPVDEPLTSAARMRPPKT